MLRQEPKVERPSLRLRAVARVSRRYPFMSGCGSLAKSRGLGLLTGDTPFDAWANVAGGRAVVPLDDLVGRCMYFIGELDRRVSAVIDGCVGQGDVVLDIGANLGLYALRMAARVGPQGQVHAFEPNPMTLAYLRRTLEANAGAGILLHEVALGAGSARMSMRTDPRNAGAAHLIDGAGGDGALVDVRALSDYARERRIPGADFIKIDVEGFEAQVLTGAETYLRAHRPRAILLEENRRFAPGDLPAALRFLSDRGYALYSLADKRFFTLGLEKESSGGFNSPGDFLAVNIDRRDEIDINNLL